MIPQPPPPFGAIAPAPDLAALLHDPTLGAEDGPEILHRSDGRALLYAAAVNVIVGEPAAGKTWVALAAVAEVVASGQPAVMLDYESTAAATAGRLRALGVTAAEAQLVAYHRVLGPIDPESLDWLRETVADVRPGLVVIDSASESLAAEGFDENSASDVGTWNARLLRPLARIGPAVLVLDHVAKGLEHRGRWARGSSAKLGVVDGAAYSLTLLQGWHRGASGRARLTIGKDRPGHVGPTSAIAAEVAVHVADEGERVFVMLDPAGDEPGGSKRREGYRSPEDVGRALHASGGDWPSQAEAADALGISRPGAKAALARAVTAGTVLEVRGPNASRAYRLPEPDRIDAELRGLLGGGPDGNGPK